VCAWVYDVCVRSYAYVCPRVYDVSNSSQGPNAGGGGWLFNSIYSIVTSCHVNYCHQPMDTPSWISTPDESAAYLPTFLFIEI